MEKKKILIIVEKYDGGLKTHLEIINKNIETYDIIQIILRGDLLHPNFKEDGEFIFFEKFNIKNPYEWYKHMKTIDQIIVNQKIDLIHLHSTVAGISGLLLKKFSRDRNVKLIYTPHAYYSQKPSLSLLKKYAVLQTEKLICSYPSKVIHVSKGEEKHALDFKIVNKQKSIVIHNGIKKKGTRKLNASNTFVFGNLARITYQKNPERFIALAAYIIRNSAMPVKFIYGGDGPGLEQMRSLVLKENLQENIKFIGYVQNKEDFFNQVDGYFSTSFYEGLPYSVIEAASYGLPLFLSNVIGHSEMIKNNGILFDLNETDEEIGKSIMKIMEDKEHVENAAKASLAMFEQFFEEKRMIESLSALYSKELSTLKY